MQRIDNLTPITAAEWPRIRDVTIPLQISGSEGSSTMELLLEQAVCFTGSPEARRLENPEDPDVAARLFGLYARVEPHIQLGTRRFRVESNGTSYRCQLGENATHQDIQLRVLPSDVPTLNDLNIPDAWRALMMDQSLLNGGLLLITAPNGQGKTTTASAIVRSRLERYAGLANTCEDPIELPLQGAWGKGLCYQRPANETGDDANPGEGYHRALLDALRQFPAITGGGTILFVGEIRDGRTAAETLKAASNGHLVVATVHARSAAGAVRRMATLATSNADGMDLETVRETLAENLRGIFYQRLLWQKEGSGWGAAQVRGEVLWSEKPESALAKAIRAGQFAAITEIAKNQTSRLLPLESTASVSADQVRKALAETI